MKERKEEKKQSMRIIYIYMRLVNIIKGKYFHLLIHRQGTTKHEKHEADGSTEGEADQGWI